MVEWEKEITDVIGSFIFHVLFEILRKCKKGRIIFLWLDQSCYLNYYNRTQAKACLEKAFSSFIFIFRRDMRYVALYSHRGGVGLECQRLNSWSIGIGCEYRSKTLHWCLSLIHHVLFLHINIIQELNTTEAQ